MAEQPAPDVSAAWLHECERRLLAAAEEAARFIAAHAGRLGELTVEAKGGAADFVSEVDRGAEALLRARLAADYPGSAFVGEEGAIDGEPVDVAAIAAGGLAFVVDPLDGTTNFLHGYPEYAVSVAAVVRGEPVAGVVWNAATGEAFAATRGGGSWRIAAGAREPVRVSHVLHPSRALVGTGIPFKWPGQFAQFLPQLERVARATSGVRRAGAAALDLCDVACGRLDAFWELRLEAWDMAAGALVVREAGGTVSDMDGRDAPVAPGPVVAGGPAMHRWLLDTLAGLPAAAPTADRIVP